MDPLSIEGAWVYQPRQFGDERGVFYEAFRAADLQVASGRRLELAQVNTSVSRRGVVRGIHFADVPPGQAKYVSCVRGAVLDVVVDVRVGSPTFGEWEAVRIDEEDRRAVYLSEGLGHAFCALTDDATVVYLCSTGYDPAVERGIAPLDPALGIDWGVDAPLLSAKDSQAPSLSAASAEGWLPHYG
ncbi:MAG: dTDP-4-dehydrorhamnose 3,5-epimerase [Frankiales bacterium]|nr:dTDP-4-dehydrorhamnose 3,5-epimerase [Frankiales bacterium]